ncbi:DUF2111 domain-containing protein [Methanocella arvoryzae]|uniref:GAF domain-containing protein n=1 Tax=Methanocella arvoryzae (strain DSM 22066 / NBRC 105507 / MRE50) TaxID=351160 RepID=Q0W3M0_METAR|nr:DUF2111 domain-containing protein [Methanocella arvoryzae]CAJ37023.1 conserved hypothetical protein [Methanocella arvoryzae MRE50]
MMSSLEISKDTPAEMLRQLAESIHQATGGMPIALKSRNMPGVFVDSDGSADTSYESIVLDSVFLNSHVRKARVDTGKYAGMPMMISPIEDTDGFTIATLGIVDALGSLSLQEFAQISQRIKNQVLDSF